MGITVTSPVSLPTMTGFTSGTVSLAADLKPDLRSTQWYGTAFGGTVPGGLRTHKPTDPCTVTLKSPARYAPSPTVDLNGNVLGSVPNNVYTLLTRKGVYVYGTQSRVMTIRTDVSVPAGADSVDSANIRAGMGLHIGVLNQQASAIADGAYLGVWA